MRETSYTACFCGVVCRTNSYQIKIKKCNSYVYIVLIIYFFFTSFTLLVKFDCLVK